jgi:Rrf2 family protein
MRLSQKTKYAFRALLSLAEARKDSDERHLMQLREISDRERVPRKFLEHIMSALQKGGIVRSQKGKGGGYALARPPERISLGEVVRLIDGSSSSQELAGEIGELIQKGDRDGALYSVFLEVQSAISDILDRRTLADLCERVLHFKHSSESPLIYSI